MNFYTCYFSASNLFSSWIIVLLKYNCLLLTFLLFLFELLIGFLTWIFIGIPVEESKIKFVQFHFMFQMIFIFESKAHADCQWTGLLFVSYLFERMQIFLTFMIYFYRITIAKKTILNSFGDANTSYVTYKILDKIAHIFSRFEY